MGLNAAQGGAIYDEILSYRTFPDGLFVADDGLRRELNAAMLTPKWVW